MSSIDLSRFNFSGGENSAPIEDLTRLPQEDQQRLVLAGIDVHDTKVSGAFMQLNHADVHCTTRQEGLDLMDIRAALKKFDGLPQYYWKLLDPNKDEITRMAYEHLNGGYFVRARKGVKISQPVQSCMFIKGNAAGQAVHNIVVVEEGAELNILGGCATSQHSNDAAHLGITEYYVEKGGKLTLDDSVAYGAVEVNGGTLSAKNSSSFVNQITLDDGSALEDAEIRSHANYLTDGNYKVEAPTAPVQTNGTVTVKGTCSIEGEGIVSSKDAQTGMIVNGGKLVIDQGATLKATGGSVDLDNGNGGAGIMLNGGSIIGDGQLEVQGGSVGMGGGNGGAGIAGEGIVAVSTLKATGGNTVGENDAAMGAPGNAGNGIDPKVLVSKATRVESKGGTGVNPGSGEYSVYEENAGGGSGSDGDKGPGSDSGSENGSGTGSGNNGGAGSDSGSDSGSNGGSDSGSGSGAGSDSGSSNNGSDDGSNANGEGENASGNEDSSQTANLPATGDAAPLGAAAVLAVVAASGVAVARRKLDR